MECVPGGYVLCWVSRLGVGRSLPGVYFPGTGPRGGGEPGSGHPAMRGLHWIGSWRALDWLKKEECPASIVDEYNMASAYNGSSYNGGGKNGLSRISTLHFEFSFFQTCVTQFKPPSMLSSASESQCPAMRIHDQMTSTLL